MTIPWMMNCSHADEGWCLTCVSKMGEELAALKRARPEEQAWNAAIESVVKLLRSNADGCSPGSAAEVQNWPFVLETMARAVEKMRRDMNNGGEKRG